MNFDFRRTSFIYKCVIENLSREAEKIIELSNSKSVNYEKLRHLYFIKDGCILWLNLIKKDPDLKTVNGDINDLLNNALDVMFKNRGSHQMCLDFVEQVLIYNNYSPSYILKSNIGMYNTFLKEVLSCTGVYSLIYGKNYSENLKFRLNLLRDGDYVSEVIGMDEVGLDKPHYYNGRLYTSLNDLMSNFNSLYDSISVSTIKKLCDLNVLPPIFSRNSLEGGKLELCWPYNLISTSIGANLGDMIGAYKNINVSDFINNFSLLTESKYSSDVLGIIKDYYCYGLPTREIALKFNLSPDKVRSILRKVPKDIINGMSLSLNISDDKLAFNKEFSKRRFGAKIMTHLNTLSGTELNDYAKYYSILLDLKKLGANMDYINKGFSKDMKILIPEASQYDNLNLVYDAELTSFDMSFLDFLVECASKSSESYMKYDYVHGHKRTTEKREFIDSFLEPYSSVTRKSEEYRFGLLLMFLKTSIILKSDIVNWVTSDDDLGNSVELPSGQLRMLGDTSYCARLGSIIEEFALSSKTLSELGLSDYDVAVAICKHLKSVGFNTINAVAFYIKNDKTRVFNSFSHFELKSIKLANKSFGIE